MPSGRNGALRDLETPHRIPPEPQPLHAPATEFTEPRATCLPPAQPRRALDEPVSRKHLGADALATRVAPTLLAFCPPLPPRPGVTQPAFDDPAPLWLLGHWRLLRSDPSLDFGPGVRMEFQRGGHLRYILSVDGRELVVPLVYRTTGDLLETDNPAASHVMSTRFTLGAGDMLI